LLLELTAPANYANAPTRIKFFAFLYDVQLDFGPQATAHSIASDHAASHFGSTTRSIATPVSDCSVAAESAAVYGYADGNVQGYRVAIVHHNRLLGIWLFGIGGVDDQAIKDALAMMSSIVWTF
jgi:hypothetical protein